MTLRRATQPPRNPSAATLWTLLLAFAALGAAGPVVAAAGASAEMEWGTMAMELFGGLAIFLFGMEQMSTALKAVAGDRMKLILAKLTSNRVMGAVTGAFVTAIVQSSSVTTVLVVGFVSAGLMSMAQSIGVIMGANVGTTITAQIIAFKVTKLALLMIAVGFGMLFTSKDDRFKHYGTMLMGLGMVFFGMSVMSEAMVPLRSYPPFLELMTRMESPLIGILVAAGFTALVQSSSATTGIVIVMASQGFITLPAGIALAFGANIGTCVTALLASIGKPREAIRAALVHVLFNVFGVLLWVGFVDQLAALVTTISPVAAGLAGTERLAAEAPRQIANAHTLFNLANTALFLGFTGAMARAVEWMVPDKPVEEGVIVKPKYLEEQLLDTPSLALDRARMELGHVGETISMMMERSIPAVFEGRRDRLREVARMDDTVDILHGAIVLYLGKTSRRSLSEGQTAELAELLGAANDLENIGDILETDITGLGFRCIDQQLRVSPQSQHILGGLHRAVTETVNEALLALRENDQTAAQRVIGMKGDVQRMMDAAAVHLASRLVANEPNRLAMYTIEVELIEKLKRIYYFAKRIAKGIVPAEIKGKA